MQMKKWKLNSQIIVVFQMKKQSKILKRKAIIIKGRNWITLKIQKNIIGIIIRSIFNHILKINQYKKNNCWIQDHKQSRYSA